MNQIQKDILTIAHQQYELGENTTIHFDYSEDGDYEEYETQFSKYSFNQINHSYDYLVNNGYIQEVMFCANSATFSLTDYGTKYYENGFKANSGISITQGDNSILVNGSNNTVTNNYSTINEHIQQSDICDEHKQLLSKLIQELSAKPKNQFVGIVKSYVLKILTEASASAAAQSISCLIAEIFSHIA